MDYKDKYLKYKSKYLNLKNQIGSGILGDAYTRYDCESPINIRLIKNTDQNKQVILLGEDHADVDIEFGETGVKRIDPKKGYDRYIGIISKYLNIAKTNKDGTHGNDPFQKVLFLIEMPPNFIILGGQRYKKINKNLKKIDTNIFEIKDNNSELLYLTERITQLKDKYNPNMKIRKYDIRESMQLANIMPQAVRDMIKEGLNENEIQDLIDQCILDIEKYVLNDEILDLPFEPHPFLEKDVNDENKEFFGATFRRKSFCEPKKFSEIFRNNLPTYNYLKNYIRTELTRLKALPKAFTNPAKAHLSIDAKFRKYQEEYDLIENLICRIMDLYGLEYIHEMPNNSTTVVISGYLHTNYIFTHLCLMNKYKLIESEKIYKNRIGPNDYDCSYFFPFEGRDEINEFNNIMSQTKINVDGTNRYRKQYFFENMLSQKPYFIYINNTKDEYLRARLSGNLQRDLFDNETLIERYGYFFYLLKYDIDKLFTSNIVFDNYYEEY